ncbi:GTP pyrophosphokinase [Massilibacterium senegalense]|uniref:GTP pyrophosphokinase n=1 Tax=Massilibacterium senegalense TaxID=1632858 RepID=UPI000781A9DB|nr:GTP pyrophosphokinase family protein [Massilibacterium senegalense]
MENWDVFLAPYKQAVNELKIKLKGIREQYEQVAQHSPIEFVTGRVKPVNSIIAKATRKGISLEQIETSIQDIAGIRVMCQFVEDIQMVLHLLRNRNDFRIVEERDYVNRTKPSGYRSYHVVIEYPVQTIAGEKIILSEIQIRTLAMNFWATIEHSLRYKYHDKIPTDIQERLLRASEAAFQLDEEMSQIREEIREAQEAFHRKSEEKHTTK